MKEINSLTSVCRHCRSYQPEGRRGGSCQILGVPVEGSWKACTLASSPFKTTLKKLEDIFHLETSVNGESYQNTSASVPIPQIETEDEFQKAVLQKLD